MPRAGRSGVGGKAVRQPILYGGEENTRMVPQPGGLMCRLGPCRLLPWRRLGSEVEGMRPRMMSIVICVALVTACDPNAKPTFGSSGLPKNCRAIIQGNLDGWHSGHWTAEEALASIERNCGANGISWGR